MLSPVNLWLISLVFAIAPAAPIAATAIEHSIVPSADTTRVFVVGPDGNEARYRVREQLARFSFPNDAVGSTRRVQGQIALDADDRVLRDDSRFVIDLASLQTDQDRRDNYVRRNTLATDSFPSLTLVPREITGLPTPLPTSGEHRFRLLSDVTLRGVTKPIFWNVTATFTPNGVTGLATTNFNFAEFGIPVPRLAFIMSVDDDIRLEYQFRLIAQQASAAR
jgi:polyisoprenoid-binding protein YceI